MKSSFKFYIWLILLATSTRTGLSSDFDCKHKFETLNDQFNENYGVDNLTAIQLAQEQLELAKSCVDDSLFVYASTNLAWIYLVVSDYNNALAHAQNAYMVAEEMNHQEMLFESLNIKGDFFWQKNFVCYIQTYHYNW